MSLSGQIASGFARVVAAINAVDAKVSGANTAARIAEGAALTLYNNPRTRDADVSVLASAPSITATLPGTATQSWAVDPSTDACVCLYAGGNAVQTGGGVWFPSVTYNVSTGQADLVWRAETECDGSVLVFGVTAWAGSGPRIMVDGVYYSLSGLANGTGIGAGAATIYIAVPFTTAKKRRVALEGRYDIKLVSVHTAGDSACTRPADIASARMVVLGDSNAAMYGYDTKGDSFAWVLADCLGLRDVQLSAVSGTGLQATNGGSNYNYVQRVTDVTGTPDVDLVLISLSWNDWAYGSGFSAAQIKSAAATLITTIRGAHAQAVILFHGIATWDIAPSDEIGLDGHESAVIEAVTESGDALVGFIPVRSAAASPIFYGGSTTPGTHAARYVNTALDHLGPDGNRYLGRWLADRVFQSLVSMSGTDAPAVLPPPAPASVANTTSGGSNVPIGYLENKQLVSKASLSSQAANTWVSLWRATGYPAQGAIPAAAAVCNDTTTGAHPLPTSTAGAQYWAGHTMRSGNSGMLTIAYDRLAHMGGLVGNVATAQNANIDLATLGVSAARIGASDYTEIDWWLEWYTATGSTAVTATVNVTYSDASTGNLNTISLAATRPAGFFANLREYLPTAKAGLGIKGVNTVQLSATTGTAGSFGVTAGRQISEATTLVANYPTTERFSASAMPDIRDDSCIAWAVLTTTTTSGALVGTFSVIRAA